MGWQWLALCAAALAGSLLGAWGFPRRELPAVVVRPAMPRLAPPLQLRGGPDFVTAPFGEAFGRR